MNDTDDARAWTALADGAEFRALVAARRRFTLPALAFALAWVALWVILAAWVPDALDGRLVGSFTLGYWLALTNFLLVWLLGGLYVRYAARTLDPLSARVRAAAPAGLRDDPLDPTEHS